MKQTIFEIIKNIPLTDNVMLMELKGDTEGIKCGQFVNILLDGVKTEGKMNEEGGLDIIPSSISGNLSLSFTNCK